MARGAGAAVLACCLAALLPLLQYSKQLAVSSKHVGSECSCLLDVVSYQSLAMAAHVTAMLRDSSGWHVPFDARPQSLPC